MGSPPAITSRKAALAYGYSLDPLAEQQLHQITRAGALEKVTALAIFCPPKFPVMIKMSKVRPREQRALNDGNP